jgi:hypothetical protein
MGFNIEGFNALIFSFQAKILENKDIADIKIREDAWTLKEMVGHLIDSASNNHQRFIRLQLQNTLQFPGYDAEEWKTVSQIKKIEFPLLVDLFRTYNILLLHLIAHMDESALDNVWDRGQEKKSLRSIVEDYFEHMKWHMNLFDERVREIRGR